MHWLEQDDLILMTTLTGLGLWCLAVRLSSPADVIHLSSTGLHNYRSVPRMPPGRYSTVLLRPRFWSFIMSLWLHPIRQSKSWVPPKFNESGNRLHLLMAGAAKYCGHVSHSESQLIFTSPHTLAMLPMGMVAKHLYWSLGAWRLSLAPRWYPNSQDIISNTCWNYKCSCRPSVIV